MPGIPIFSSLFFFRKKNTTTCGELVIKSSLIQFSTTVLHFKTIFLLCFYKYKTHSLIFYSHNFLHSHTHALIKLTHTLSTLCADRGNIWSEKFIKTLNAYYICILFVNLFVSCSILLYYSIRKILLSYVYTRGNYGYFAHFHMLACVQNNRKHMYIRHSASAKTNFSRTYIFREI